MSATQTSISNDGAKKFSSGELSAVVIIATLLIVLAGWALVRFYLLPQSLPVVNLSEQEAAEARNGRPPLELGE